MGMTLGPTPGQVRSMHRRSHLLTPKATPVDRYVPLIWRQIPPLEWDVLSLAELTEQVCILVMLMGHRPSHLHPSPPPPPPRFQPAPPPPPNTRSKW